MVNFSVDVRVNFDIAKLDIGRINQRSLRAASEQIRTLAAKNSPYKTGNLSQSIGVQPSQDAITPNTKQVRIGPRNVIYAKIQEYGGTIYPKKAKALKFQVNGKWVSAKSVTIPGKHYMQRTWEASKRIVDSTYHEAVAYFIKKI